MLVGLLGDGVADSSTALDLRNAAMTYCKRAMTRRNGLVITNWTKRLERTIASKLLKLLKLLKVVLSRGVDLRPSRR